MADISHVYKIRCVSLNYAWEKHTGICVSGTVSGYISPINSQLIQGLILH